MDNFKKGVELFALGIALLSASFAMWVFFASQAQTGLENLVTVLFVLFATFPIVIVGSMSIGASLKYLFPDNKIINFLMQAHIWITTFAFIALVIFTDFKIGGIEKEEVGGLSYGIHSVHYYNEFKNVNQTE